MAKMTANERLTLFDHDLTC